MTLSEAMAKLKQAAPGEHVSIELDYDCHRSGKESLEWRVYITPIGTHSGDTLDVALNHAIYHWKSFQSEETPNIVEAEKSLEQK